MPATQDNRNIKVSTTLGPDVLMFHRLAGRDGMSELGAYHLDLLSETFDLNIADVLGKSLSVTFDIGAGTVRQLNGIVTRFVLTGRAGRFASYQATVRPWLWFLTRASDCRIFQDKDAVAVIKTVFEKYALADYDLSQLSATPPPMPYCVQYRETDFAFVSRLMERFGIYYYFRHAGGRHTLVLADSKAAHERIAGKATLQFYPDAPGRARANETVYSWQAAGEILSDESTLRDFNFETPSVDLTAKSTVTRDYDGAGLEMYDYPGGYGVRADGEALAKTWLEAMQAGYQTIDAHATAGAIAPGGLFTLAEHPRADQNSEMLVVAADYTLYSDRFESDLGRPDPKAAAPLSFDCRFSAIPKSATFRGAQQTPRPLVRGPQTAIVVGKAGEEIWTDKYGRIKVQFHWDRLGADDETSSCWVRVGQAWAGKRFGQLFIPRIGQEVIVSFLEGDPDQPLVTGAVYNATNMPPLSLPDEASRSTIKTNTTKGGVGFNEIRFEDKKDSEEIFIQAEKDFNRVVKNNDTLKVGFEKADKGDQTIQIKNDRTLEVGHDLSTTVTNDETHKVQNNQTLNVTKDRKLDVGGNETVTVTGDQKVTVSKTIVIEATTSIELKVGGSSIKIEPAKVTIKSPEIAVQADGMMGVKAGGILTIEGAMVKIN